MPIGIKDQYFGTEIEMTGITRRKAAEAVAELFGTSMMAGIMNHGQYETGKGRNGNSCMTAVLIQNAGNGDGL